MDRRPLLETDRPTMLVLVLDELANVAQRTVLRGAAVLAAGDALPPLLGGRPSSAVQACWHRNPAHNPHGQAAFDWALV